MAGGFHSPAYYGKLTGMTAPDLLPWEASALALQETEGKLVAEMWSALRQQGNLELVDAKTNQAFQTLPVTLAAGKSELPLGPRSAFRGDTLRLRFADKPSLYRFVADLKLPFAPSALEAWLTRNFYTDGSQIAVWVHTIQPEMKVQLLGPSGTSPMNVTTDRIGWALIAYPLPGRAPGQYPLRVRLPVSRGGAGQEVALTALVQPPGKIMTQWDPGTGCLIVEGQPYLQLGVGGGGVKVETVRDTAAAGLNSMHVWFHSPVKWPDPADPGQVRGVLDECRRLGIRVISACTLSPSTCQTFAEWKTKAMDIFAQTRDHPAMLAWDIIDEPGPNWARDPDWTEGNLQELHDACKVMDPYRPAFVNYYAWKPGYGFYGGLNSTDIYSADCYFLGNWYGGREPWRTATKSLALQTKMYDTMYADAHRDGKPCHFWLHFYGGDDSYREPSIAENNAQTWLAFIHGFRMVSYFVYRPMSLDLWHSVKPLVAEITSLTNVFGTPPLPGVVQSADPAIHCAAFRCQGAWYFVTCNATEQPVTTQLRLWGPPGGQASVLFEKRTVHSGAILRDTWGPLQRHVYKLPEAR
jgi:hypothetical protein